MQTQTSKTSPSTTRCAWCGKKATAARALFAAKHFLDALRADGHCHRAGDRMHLSCGTAASRARLGLVRSNPQQFDATLNRKAGH